MWWFYFHARRFLRSFMRPVPVADAYKWTRRMQFLYIFMAWNFAGFVFIHYYKDKSPRKPLTPEEKYKQMARNFRTDELVAYRFSGGSVHRHDIDLKKDLDK